VVHEESRMREMVEYSKAIWDLPFEEGTPNVNPDHDLWKIKIQRFISLVKKAVKLDAFHPPYRLSPFTEMGVQQKMLETLDEEPILDTCMNSEGEEKIRDLKSAIANLKAEDKGQNQAFFQGVLSLLKRQFENLCTTAEDGSKVRQFSFVT
jgi:hypothetical protein